jgi:hypothetical protein
MRVSRPAAALVGAVLLGLAAGCAASPGGVNPHVDPPVTVDAIADHPDQYYGRRVALTAAIDAILGSRAFTVADDDPARKERMLVVTRRRPATGERPGLARGDVVIMNGTVRRFVAAELEPEFGIDLDPEIEKKLEGRPVLVASDVRKVGTVSDEPSR